MKRIFAVLVVMVWALWMALMFSGTGQAVTVAPAPMPKLQFLDNTGKVLSGGQVYTYAPGSTTPTATYTDSTGAVPNTNPVILDSAGRANIWINGCVKFVVQTSASVTLYTTDNVCQYALATPIVSQWQSSGLTPTYLSATSFSVPGDQTGTLEAGDRIKTTNTGGTVYSTIASSSFGAGVTTVTVVNDSASTLDSGLSTVNISILTVSNPAIPVPPVVTKASGYTIAASDCGHTLIANLSSAATFTLPAASAVPSGCSLVTKATGSVLTIGGTVDGVSNPTVGQSVSMILFSDGTSWYERRVANAAQAATATTATTAGSLVFGNVFSGNTATVNVGTVTAGDVIDIQFQIGMQQGSATGGHQISIGKDSGTATLVSTTGNSGVTTYIRMDNTLSGTNYRSVTLFGRFLVTGSGTLAIGYTRATDGTAPTMGTPGWYGWFVKKQ